MDRVTTVMGSSRLTDSARKSRQKVVRRQSPYPLLPPKDGANILHQLRFTTFASQAKSAIRWRFSVLFCGQPNSFAPFSTEHARHHLLISVSSPTPKAFPRHREGRLLPSGQVRGGWLCATTLGSGRSLCDCTWLACGWDSKGLWEIETIAGFQLYRCAGHSGLIAFSLKITCRLYS